MPSASKCSVQQGLQRQGEVSQRRRGGRTDRIRQDGLLLGESAAHGVLEVGSPFAWAHLLGVRNCALASGRKVSSTACVPTCPAMGGTEGGASGANASKASMAAMLLMSPDVADACTTTLKLKTSIGAIRSSRRLGAGAAATVALLLLLPLLTFSSTAMYEALTAKLELASCAGGSSAASNSKVTSSV